MGFFSNLFGRQSAHEHQLEDAYVQMFRVAKGMSPPEARHAVQDLIREAKEEGQREGTANLPPNFGDTLLAREATEERTRAMLAVKREDGVRDEDIRWWWNIPDLDRRMLLKDDDLTRMAVFTHHVQKGLTPDQATARVRKYHPMYGDPADSSGDDRPLPYELKDRVNVYIQNRMQSDPGAYMSEIESASSFNALVRRGIRNGEI